MKKVNVKKLKVEDKSTGNRRKLLTQGITLFIAIIVFIAAYCYVHYGMTDKSDVQVSNASFYVKGTVTKILADNAIADETTEGVKRGSQEVQVTITSGEHKGKTYLVTNYMSALFNIDAKEGTKVIVRFDAKSTGGYSPFIYSYDRSAFLYGAVALFALLVCIIGGRKGVMALVSLLYMLCCILLLLIPALYRGAPTLPTTLLIIIGTTMLTFILLDGINKKTISATIGTVAGVMTSAIFAVVMGRLTNISGFQTNEAETLLMLASDHGLKITNLFTTGILLAALGAVMDVAMSIASAIHEIHEVNPKLQMKQLFRSGMNIGKDAMGTMVNTLILAFAGSSLNLMLVVYTNNIPFMQLWNTDLVARELIQGLGGSIGIVMTVPLVAFLSSYIETKVHSK